MVRDRAGQLVRRSHQRALHHHPAALLAVRFGHGDLPRRTAEHRQIALRGRRHRRGEQAAQLCLHHHPADHAGDLLQPDHADGPGLPGVQRPLHHHPGRAAQIHLPAAALHLRRGLQALRHGLCLGHRVGAFPHHHGADPRGLLVLEEMGLLRRRQAELSR